MQRFKWLIPCLVFILGALQMHALYHKGVKAGMDHIVPEAIEDNTWAISVAISDMIDGLHDGYLYYGAVFDALNKGGMTKYDRYLHDLPVLFPNNLRDGDMIDHALHMALGADVPPHPSLENGDVHPMPYTDLGLADYFKLGFALFGFTIASAYKLYFVILGIGAIAFFAEFRDRPLYLLMALGFLSVVSVLMDMMTTTGDIDLATLYNFRCLSSLAILPGLHLLLLMLDGRIADRNRLALAALQCAIMVFIATVRCSSTWIMLMLTVAALFYGLRAWRGDRPGFLRKWRDAWPLLLPVAGVLALGLLDTFFKQRYIIRHHLSDHKYWGLGSSALPALLVIAALGYGIAYLYRQRLTFCAMPGWLWQHRRQYKQALSHTLSSLKTTAVWPVLMLMGMSLCYNTYVTWIMHPVYSTEQVLPYHMRYHNAYLGMATNPRFYTLFSKEINQGGFDHNTAGDALGYNASFRELARLYAAQGKVFAQKDFISPYTHTIRFGLHDYYVRRVLLKFIIRHPLFTLQTEWYKFIGLWQLWYGYIGVSSRFGKMLMLSVTLVPLTLFGLRRQWLHVRQVQNSVIAALLLGLFVHVPSLYAYPAVHVCTDQMLVLSVTVLFTLSLLMTLVLWRLPVLRAITPAPASL